MKSLLLTRSSLQRRFPFGAALALLSTTALAVLGGCLTDEDIDRGTTDETNTARIVGPGGSSAPGAVVRFFDPRDTTRVPLFSDTADAEGRYSTNGLPEGVYNLRASRGDLELFRDSVRYDARFRRVDTLRHPGSLRGRVELEPGHDLRTAWVHAVGTDFYVNVASDGTFLFPHIAGGRYTLRAVSTLPDYTPTFAAAAAVDDSTVALQYPIRLIYTGTQPTIVLPGGAGAAGATVRFFRVGDLTGDAVLTTLADAGGRYDASALPPGRYNLLAASGAYLLFRDSVSLIHGARRIDTLGLPGSLQGRVEVLAGHDPRGGTVRLAGTGLLSLVDSAGHFAFPQVAAGRYTLSATVPIPGYEPTSTEARVFADSAAIESRAIAMTFSGVLPVRGLSARVDTAAGTVRLRWSSLAGVAQYEIHRDTAWESGDLTSSVAIVSDTVWEDKFFRVGAGTDTSRQSSWEASYVESALPLGKTARYQVCGRIGTARGTCAAVEVRPAAPYAVRHSGMRWTRLGAVAAAVVDPRSVAVRVIRDSLWVFPTKWGFDYRLRYAAWKSADGADWSLVSDSLPIGRGDDVDQRTQVWNDSLWRLRQEADTLQLLASRDGVSWSEVSLPRTYTLAGYTPPRGSLFALPHGLVVRFSGNPEWAYSTAIPRGIVRGERGGWSDSGSRYDAYYDNISGSVVLSATEAGVWRAQYNAFKGYRFGPIGVTAASSMDTPTRPFPVAAQMDELVQIHDLLYAPGGNAIFATTVSTDGSWWYIDFPGGNCTALTTWGGKLVALGSDGGVWLGEPTPAP